MSSSGYCDDKQDPSLPRAFKLEDIQQYLPLRYKDKVELEDNTYVLIGYPFVTYNDINGPFQRIYTTERSGKKLDWSKYLDDKVVRSATSLNQSFAGLTRVVCSPRHFVKGEILALTYSNLFQGDYLVYVIGSIYPPLKANVNRDEFVAIRVRQTAGPAFVSDTTPSPEVVLPPIVEPQNPEPKPELPLGPPAVTPPVVDPITSDVDKPKPEPEEDIPFSLTLSQTSAFGTFKDLIVSRYPSGAASGKLKILSNLQATTEVIDDFLDVEGRVSDNEFMKEAVMLQLLSFIIEQNERRSKT